MQTFRRLRAHPWIFRLLWFVLIAVPLGVAALFAGMEVSSQPGFCGTCHYMQPYYRSWQTSSHSDVSCVECHIPPGIGAEFQKKYEALSMVASYITGTYGTNPWAEVPDASCLRPGCHEERLLAGREVFSGILFDHRPHLTELRRGKRLRCTSCHSQIVQGEHIAVTESSCFLCHFKDQELNQDTASCTLCHETPEKTITTAGLRFEHADVKRFGMECTLCHGGVVAGQGEVPRQRCLSCHNEPSRLSRVDETRFLHRMHVTEHKVECLSCHVEIQHRTPERLERVGTSCETCHVGGGHSPQRDLYVGIGGTGAKPESSTMYLAGVSCGSCHLVTQDGKRVANEVSCMSCHGSSFLRIYNTWQKTLRNRLQQVQSASVEVAKRVPASSEGLQRARENLGFVRRADPVHNPEYASTLLKVAYQDLQEALSEADAEMTLESPPWPETPYETGCTACHMDAASIAVDAEPGRFQHQVHAVEGELRCAQCHEDRGYREESHGRLAKTCTDCHPTRQQLERASPADCLQCHTEEIPPRSEIVNFPHKTHVGYGLNCTLCHTQVQQLDHLQLMRAERPTPPLNHDFCGRCHQGNVPPLQSNTLDPCRKCHTNF